MTQHPPRRIEAGPPKVPQPPTPPPPPPSGPAPGTDPIAAQPATPGLDLDEIETRIEKAHDHIAKLCSGEERWTMRVPAQPERDSDLVISAAVEDAGSLVAEVRRLRELTNGFRRERAILRWAADRLAENGLTRRGGLLDDMLRRWADELDAAPAAPTTYALPAEPPETVTELWDRDGVKWGRVPDDGSWRPADDPEGFGIPWCEALEYGPLSTAPPAGTEGDRDG